ncbi:MAG TPA: UbiA-like polyprenyltransferase [Candidatus Eremiobacteraceae bacterium]|nr:UbiA-like polyprenyltransferase [Candidatus Eremiobacteraceae bacterium]
MARVRLFKSERAVTAMLRVFLREIKIEHTLFALPFAYVGALLAYGGVPPWEKIAWITVAVLGGRTAAMAANRLIDARIDAKNPRTASRALATGALKPAIMVWSIAAGLLLLVVAAYELNPLCFALVPLAAGGLIVYPYVKRVSWGVHFFLGAVDALAPLGAWIAITGRFEVGGWLLFAAVTLWVAGFDILYALMDRDFDLREGIASVPARFGEGSGRALPQVLHLGVVAALAWLGIVVGAHGWYWAGVAAAGALLAVESVLVRKGGDVFSLNAAVFNANMIFSVVFLCTTLVSLVTGVSSHAAFRQ